MSRNSEDSRRGGPRHFDEEYQNGKKLVSHIPPMRLTKQKKTIDQLRDDYSSGICTTEKSESRTPRVQSETNLEYFQEKRTIPARPEYGFGNKVARKETDEQIGRSQKKKRIVLSKRSSLDDGLEFGKASQLKFL